ncbi:ATP-grasp domain-containing protein [Zavarzinella formosa]|uniref:ATP-grasp domain-containing protein n=1 Tax=Zavarzinella formosa TaxID=360055 RepID=UPI0002D7DF5E|nr:ATP-grasp domain-containing protein [Zavarzinella formosa]
MGIDQCELYKIMPTLILTPRFTDDAQALWRAAGRMGWGIRRLTSWRVSDDERLAPDPVLYLEGLFGPTLAEQFGLRLLEPAIDWLPRLPKEYRRRHITLTTFGAARQLTEPAFVKPPNDKSFKAGVFVSDQLPAGVDDLAPVLIAEVVRWEKEFRCFVLDRVVRTISVYLRNGILQREQDFAAEASETADALAFARQVIEDPRVDLPKATVIDVGVIAGRGWAVVEQNAAWASGIYGCDPEQVLETLQFAAVRE